MLAMHSWQIDQGTEDPVTLGSEGWGHERQAVHKVTAPPNLSLPTVTQNYNDIHLEHGVKCHVGGALLAD
jgi:hypothetical protein